MAPAVEITKTRATSSKLQVDEFIFKTTAASSKLQVDELIFAITFVAAFALLNLPYDHVKGSSSSNVLVPKVIFKDNPSLFHAFVLALNFAFTGAVMSICTRQGYPKLARNSRRFSLASVAAALGVFTFSATALSRS